MKRALGGKGEGGAREKRKEGKEQKRKEGRKIIEEKRVGENEKAKGMERL